MCSVVMISDYPFCVVADESLVDLAVKAAESEVHKRGGRLPNEPKTDFEDQLRRVSFVHVKPAFRFEGGK